MAKTTINVSIGSGADDEATSGKIGVRRVNEGPDGDMLVVSDWKDYPVGPGLQFEVTAGELYQSREREPKGRDRYWYAPETDTNYVDLEDVFPLPPGEDYGPQGPQGVPGPQGTSLTGEVTQPTPTTMALELSDGTTTDPITLPAGPGGSDAGVAGYLADPASASAVAVAAKIVTVGAPPPTGVAATDTANLLACVATVVAAGGGTIVLHAGTYVVNQSMPILSNLTWRGQGSGATIVKIANGSNLDVFRSDDFANLTMSGNPGGPQKWKLVGLTIDGNRSNNTAGRGVSAFGYAFAIEDVIIRNAADDGLYTEWSFVDAGSDGMEATLTGVRIHSNGKWGWWHRGPHDSVVSKMIVFGNNQSGGNYGGIWAENDNVNGTQKWLAGGLHLTDVHVWGTSHKWAVIAEAGIYSVNSQFEGASVGQILVMAPVVMRGGKVFNITNNGRQPNKGIQMGDDGSTAGYANTRAWTIGACNIDVQLQGFYGSSRASAPIDWVAANASEVKAQAAMVSAPGATAIDSGAVGVQLGSLTSLTVASASAFPLSGRVLVPVAGGIVTLAYTGISGNTLTGVTRVSGNATDTVAAGNASLVVQVVWGTYDKQSKMSARATHGSASPIERAGMSSESTPLRERFYGGASGAVNTLDFDGSVGHIAAPGIVSPLSLAPHANLGTGGAATSGGNDVRGQVAIVAGSASISAGTAVTVTLPNAFEVSNPTVVASAANAATAALDPYATSTGRGVFLIGFRVAPTAGTTYYVNYICIG